MTNSNTSQEVWIGVAEVRQRAGAGVLMDRNEAFVNVLANASGEPSFRAAVSVALHGLGFDLVSVEDPEPLSRRREHYLVTADVLELAEEVKRRGLPRLGDFYTWRSKGEESV